MVVTEETPDPPTKRSDAEIVAALRAGDADVFQTVVLELNPGLLRLARTYVSAALAEEVVQDTWVAVVRSISSFEERSSLKTWIYQIMMNKVRSLARREAKIIPFAALGNAGTDDDASVDPDRLVDAERFDSHLTCLIRNRLQLPVFFHGSHVLELHGHISFDFFYH